MNSYTVVHMATYTVPYIKSLPAPRIRKLVREAGYTLREIGRLKKPPVAHSVVGRTIRKQIASDPVWDALVHCLNHPKRERVIA